MTDPHLWLDGDPVDGRTAHRLHPVEPPPPPPPAPIIERRGGLLRAAVGGGAVAAGLLAAALFGLGAFDNPDPGPPPVATVAGRKLPAGDIQAIYASASPGVVSVRAGRGSGTGFVIDREGTLVTNAHVVQSAGRVQVQFESSKRVLDADVAGVDASTDLAVLKVDPTEAPLLRPLRLGDSDAVRVGQLAVAIGSPFGLDQTATAGIVSGLEREIQAPNGFQIDRVIQTDAPINPGNSGGPLLDAKGRVIGVNSQIATGNSGGGNVGVGFAVPSNTVKEVVPKLARGEIIERPYLGISTAPGVSGPEVQDVTPSGPAARAGVRGGDTILEVDGKRVTTPEDVSAAIEDRQPGDEVKVTVERAGEKKQFDIQLGARPAQTP